MLQVKLKTDDKVQGETLDSSTDSQIEEFEFSYDLIKPVVLDEDYSVSNGDRHEAIQE